MKIGYIGIDPGKSGGIACCYNDDKTFISSKCPEDPADMNAVFEILAFGCDSVLIKLEHVWGFPTDSSKTAFTFGWNFGCWQTIAEIFKSEFKGNCTFELVSPRVWQKHFNTPKSDKKKRKAWLKKLAAETAAKLIVRNSRTNNVTFNISDAILISKYCKDIES
jgi:hypothetical protein